MKQTLTILLLLAALLVPGNTSAQTIHSYTDAQGLTWYFSINGANEAELSYNPYNGPSPSGPSITTKTWTGPYGQITSYIYQGNELRVPSAVSDGTNTYPVTGIADGALGNLFTAEKIIIPATVKNEVHIHHHTSRRFVVEPGSQITKLYRWGFGYLHEFLPRKTTLYYDFMNATITDVYTTCFFQIFNNTLIFLGAGSKTPSNYTLFGSNRKSFDIKDNWIIGNVCDKFSLDDAEDFESPHTFTAVQASYNRTFSNTSGKAVSTLYLPYPTDLPTGMQAYEFIFKGLDEDGNKAFCFAPVPLGTRLEAYKPYLVRITDGASHTLPTMQNVQVPATPDVSTTAQISADGDWAFNGTTEFIGNTEAYAKKAYYLNGNKWWAVQNGVANDYIAPFRCFISSPTGATPAKSFFMVLDDDNTATDVRHLENATEADIKSGRYPFYSIDGKLIGNDYDALERGQMYIVNGKKFYKF